MKMVLKSQTSGSVLTSMWDNGRIIKSMDSESSTSKMEINMKEAGAKTKDMVRVHFGCATPKANFEGSILVTGKMTRKREEALCSSKKATDTMECGWTTTLTEKAE